MPGDKKKEAPKLNSIPSKIIEAISSVYPEELISNESCPFLAIKNLSINETEEKNKKKVEKEYKIGNYLIKKTLGQGTFGKVKLGIYLPNKEKVAIKILEKDRILEKDDGIRVKREFDMLAKFNHPNVILVAEIFESSDSYYSVMEYCQGGELFNYIVKNRRLSDEEASFFYFQLINGLEYLHSLGIVHRDLKPENLLLTNEHLLKIIDFGLSNYFQKGQKNLLSTPCGSPCYASPEMVAGKKYNGFKIDIWSTGIILYAMLCGYLPFEDKDNDVLFEKILECKLVFPKYISKNAKDLMQKILVTDPEKRITIPEIKNHPFYLNGKSLFEQDFSIYQINKDTNDKNNNSEDNVDLNNILDTPELKENADINNNEKRENKENKENVDNNINSREGNDENINNGREIKEIEIDLNNKMKEGINYNNSNNNNKNKNKINSNKDNKKEEYYNLHRKFKTYELEPIDYNIDTGEKITSKGSNNEKNTKKQNKDQLKSINISKSKGKNHNTKKLSLLKDSKNIERKRLIKNARKLNICTGSHAFKTSKKLNEIINYNNFRNRLFQIKKMDIFSHLKTDKNTGEKNVLSKKLHLIRKKLSSKNDLKNKLNLENENNIPLYKLNNNTIDDNGTYTKLKLQMKFQNLNYSNVKKNSNTKTISKNNMKLSLLDASKLKKIKNNKNRIYQINSSIKKSKNKRLNINNNNIHLGNWNTLKYNLLHKKNLKEININLQKTKKVILSNNPENKKEKTYSTNQKTIDTSLNTNNMNIIENPENANINNGINNLAKLTKKNMNKKLSIKPEKKIKTNYTIKIIDKEKNLHHVNKTTGNLNTYFINENINYKKLSNKATKKELKKKLNINIEINNKKNNLGNLLDKNENLDIFESIIKTEPNQHKYIKAINQTDKKEMNNNKLLKENKRQFIQVKLPIFNPANQNKSNLVKKQKNEISLNTKNKIPKNLNRTSNSNFNSFIQNPFTVNNQNSINKLFIHANNGSFSQNEQNVSKKLNEKNNNLNDNLSNLNTVKKKPLVSIRNTVINFNMIDSGLILDSLKRKKKGNKLLSNNFAQNNSLNKLQNNHLFGLCSKFNSNISFNNNEYDLNKTKTINANSTNKKIFKYGDKRNNKYNSKRQINNQDKNHSKYNSMRLEDYYGLKKRKYLKNINTNKIDSNVSDSDKLRNIEINHFNTINN